MLDTGDRVPDMTVWRAPRQPATLRELADGRPILLVFYLFDWSAT